MASKGRKNKKNLLKEQILQTKKLNKELAKIKSEKVEYNQKKHDLYWNIKLNEKIIDDKYHAGQSLTDEEFRNLGEMVPNYVKKHWISTSHRVNMLQKFGKEKLRTIEMQRKHINTLTRAVNKSKPKERRKWWRLPRSN